MIKKALLLSSGAPVLWRFTAESGSLLGPVLIERPAWVTVWEVQPRPLLVWNQVNLAVAAAASVDLGCSGRDGKS